jgi:hypothetical protein
MMGPEELQPVTTYQPALSFDDSLPKRKSNCIKGTRDPLSKHKASKLIDFC